MDKSVKSSRLAELEAVLGAQEDATGALAQWCTLHGLATNPDIRVTHVTGQDALLPPDAQALLAVDDQAMLSYRHIQLHCDGTLLSQAHNWFVPSRLTRAMNHTLATTNTPFGVAVAALCFSRHRLDSCHGRRDLSCPSATVLTHRALLRRADGQPISLVVECYQPGVLAFD